MARSKIFRDYGLRDADIEKEVQQLLVTEEGKDDLAEVHEGVSFYFGDARAMKLQVTEHEKLGTFG